MSEQSNLSNFGTGGSVQADQVVESDLCDEKLYRNEEWLRKQYHENGINQAEIAELTDVTKTTISNWMQRHGIDRRSAAEAQTDGDLERLKNEEWLRDQYCEQEKSSHQIADELDLDPGTVRNWMQKYGIKRRSAGRQTNGNIKPLKKEKWLREQYCKQQKSISEIADELGVDNKTVRNWMQRHGIDRRSATEAQTDGDLERLKNEEWLREQYSERERTTYEIADELGLSQGTVRNWMQRHGIDRRSAAEAQTDGDLEKLKNREWLREQYWEQEKSLHQIADELDLSNTTIKRGMQMHGIDRRSLSESHTEGNLEKLKNREWLREQYWEQEKTTHEIADELSLSQATVSVWMEKHGTERRSAGPQTDGNPEPLRNDEWLREQYCEQRKTTYEIADELGLCKGTVRNWMQRHGIDRRSAAEAQTDGDLERLKNEEWLREQYSERERTTYEIADELNLGRSVVTRALKDHGIEIRSLHMDPDYLPHHVIGELELTAANYLHDSEINYGYETLIIECGKNRAYIPDFVTENYVIECKGTDWGKVYDSEVTAEQKAEAAMKQLDEREYVVVGMQLPCDIHVPREEHGTIQELFE
jgi:transposase-like protein